MSYFYIIQHIESQKFYAGSRWAAGSNPNELLTENGYRTSSPQVHRIIDLNGMESFRIVRIKEFINPEDAYSYETRFLQKVKAKTNDKFINQHENDKPAAWGTSEHKQYMMNKYGVTHNTQIPEVLERMKASSKKFYEAHPEKLLERAAKNLQNKIARGTTGKGIPKPPRPEGHKIGKYERSLETRQKLSDSRKGRGTGKDNAMADAANRAKVGATKVGKRKYYNEDKSQAKMYYPGTEPNGWTIAVSR